MGHTLKALALAGACGLAVCGVARADEIYDFDVTSSAAGPHGPPAITLDLAQPVSSFTLSGMNNGANPPPVFSGDVADLVSLDIGGERVTPSYLYGDLSANFSFGAGGAVTASTLDFLGVSVGVDIAGTGSTASGTFGSDDPLACSTGSGCALSGTWTLASSPVSEPATFAILGAGLIALAASRRRVA